jgi:hypothetical protein
MLVAKPIVLELDEHVALQNSMIENEIDEEMLAADDQSLLTRFETEPVTELE